MEQVKDKAVDTMRSMTRAMHQAVAAVTGESNVMTDNFGHPLGDTFHSLNVNGHVLASDVMLMEKQQTFNRGKIVERMVHPCGAGAFGYFETTKDMSRYTKAKFLNGAGKKTPIFIRFSTVTYGKEFPDSARNPRGFAVKFYTEDGNYDLVGLNFPVFFVRDPAMGPDNIRSQQRNPENFLLDLDSLHDFISLVPESLHCATMFWSDYGTPYGFRHMNGYGVHTFKWVNESGEEFYVKYHFISEQGIKNFTWDEAVRMCGVDPDFAKRDLYESIKAGNESAWKAYVQIMPVAEAANYRFDPFDATKVWYHSDYPLIEFGRLVVNKNPENYHRDVEQAAFSPGSLVPGIELSPDALLQFRSFFYRDAQFYRLGVNLHQIPVNCPFMSTRQRKMSRDGLLRVDDNGVGEPHYYPNSFSTTHPDRKYNFKPVPVSGVIDRKAHTKHEASPEDDLIQARELFARVMSPQQRERLFYNIAQTLKMCKPGIQQRSLIMFYKVHPDYGKGVARALGVSIDNLEKQATSAPTVLVDRQHGYSLVHAT